MAEFIGETAYSAERQKILWEMAIHLSSFGWSVSIIDSKNAQGQCVTRIEAKNGEKNV